MAMRIGFKWIWLIFVFIILSSHVFADSAYLTDINDVYVNQSSPDTNYNSLYLETRSFIMWDISVIPANSIINLATWKQGYVCHGCDPGAWYSLYYFVKNQSWNENTTTWNNQPCQDLNDTSKCLAFNLTGIISPPDGYSYYWNITNMLQYAINNNYSNFSYAFIPGGDGCEYSDKEYSGGCANWGLYLNVSYTNCTPSLTCGSWSSCSNNSQYRNCDNGCTALTNETRSCIMPYASNQTTALCHDNSTLLTTYIYVTDGLEHDIVMPTLCRNGCDNITAACNPPTFMTNLETALIIISFLLIIGLFAFWMVTR